MTGPAILICNHTSSLDPILIQAPVPRFIHWMMAREYFEMKSLRWAFELLDTIPVDRGHRDTSATRAALRALNDGKLLGIFPEGRIELTRHLLPFEPGVAMLARRSGAGIYPAYLDGSQRGHEIRTVFNHRQHANLVFGPMVNPGHSDRETTEAMRSAIENLERSRRP